LSVLIRALATFGFTGYFPIAPATFASAVFCAIYYLVPGGEWLAHPVVLVATLVISIPVSTWMEKDRGKDPGCVVIDEVVGMQVVLTLAGDVTLHGVVAAFLLFRIFDIAKPFPVGRSQRLPGGWGIVIDDFLAGLYTRAALVLLALAWPQLGRFGW
jgi:phosphatidylglycerophosphatase A